jgi:uncharacterized iron-regulated membrane protein
MTPLALRLHRWIGLTLAALWLVQGLTGAAIVFQREFQIIHYGFSPADARPLVSPGVALAAAEAATGEKVMRFNIHSEDRRGYQAFVGLRGERTVFIDARTGEVKGVRLRQPPPGGEGTFAFLYDIHHDLLLGKPGKWLLAISGMFLLISMGFGLKQAWPRKGQWRRTLLPNLKGGIRAKLYQMHRASGLVVGGFLALTVFCGVVFVWAPEIRTLTGAVQAPRGLTSQVPADGAAMLTPDAAIAIGMARYPAAQLAGIDPATKPDGIVRVRLTQPGESRAFLGATQMVLDAYSGKVLYDYNALQAPLINRLLDLSYSIHTGEIYGNVSRALVLLMGISLVAFCITGIWMWLLRRKAA